MFEQHYWNIFLKSKFPGYGEYWSKYVTPLANRPNNINFKTSNELAKLGFVSGSKIQLNKVLETG